MARTSYCGQKFEMLTVIDEREVITTERVLCLCDCGNNTYASVANMKRKQVKSCGCLPKKSPNDLRGRRFGKLTVIELLPKNAKDRRWRCLCDCGNYTEVIPYSLKSGHTTSCGCVPCKKPLDLTGKRFGRLVAIKPSPRTNNGTRWLCLCDCGNEVEVVTPSLTCGVTKSCGCFVSDKISEIKTIDVSGQKFGKLLVISREKSYKKMAMWKCVCDCGNECVVAGKYLRNGTTSSCGCLKSKAEMTCKLILSSHGKEFVPQKTFEDCKYKRVLQFDIYINVLNVCIELDGKQHFEAGHFFGEKEYEEQKIRDKIKNKYCKDNNIKLIRIPYTQFNHIEEILRENKII